MKQVLLTWCLAVAAAVVLLSAAGPSEASPIFGSDCGTNASHNYFYGRREDFDQELTVVHVNEPYKFLRRIEVDVSYPKKGDFPPRVTRITYMEAVDQKTDGNGACVYLEEGGVGTGTVTFKLESARNQDIDHIVKIYGYY